MALSVFTILIFALLVEFSVSDRGVMLAKFGENVSITCPCSRLVSCEEKFVRWLKITVDGTATVIDTACEQTCRISQRKKDSSIELILRQVGKNDEGRYYCYSSRYLILKGRGTFLQIEEPGNWTNKGEVTLLTELENYTVKPEFPRQTVLYCLVNDLLTPNISITWHSSKGQKEPGQTWLSGGFEGVTAGSRLHINMTSAKDSYVSPDTEERNEQWWCEVHHGNVTLRSNMTSLYMSTGYASFYMLDNLLLTVSEAITDSVTSQSDEVSEWCSAVLYSAVALVLLCVLSLVLLTSHWLLYLHKGKRVSVSSVPMSTSQDDTNVGVVLQLSQRPTPSGQVSNRDTEEYSVLRFQPTSSHQNNRPAPASTSVTYAALNFQLAPPGPGRRHRGKPRVAD